MLFESIWQGWKALEDLAIKTVLMMIPTVLMLMCSIFIHFTPGTSQRLKMSTECLRSINTDGKIFCPEGSFVPIKTKNLTVLYPNTLLDPNTLWPRCSTRKVSKYFPQDCLVTWTLPTHAFLVNLNMVLRKTQMLTCEGQNIGASHYESSPSVLHFHSPNMSQLCRYFFFICTFTHLITFDTDDLSWHTLYLYLNNAKWSPI